ncbi:phosphatase PAP2 family protein [Flavisolibacter ginsenosidimutans]|uniref:Phosphatase PAP2 family protein n=1 Tax=Flavisolibacter ginsenosidimutans TaxID=661481 RepID=A0A5B8UHH6_9BACT|nr:phosphatase PAP2 family protein [Flavisolibacter ginsenosidimutans]QEC55579.1 phosphatase PAP2 family protein [Flavisolibacter ginsenosidimutans]
MRLPREEYNHFLKAVFFSIVIALLLATFVAIYGKDKSFLMVNGHYSVEADYFFNWMTFLGEWLLWVPLFVYALFYKRDFLIAAFVALALCSLITFLFKQVVFPGQPRPLRLLHDLARVVPVVKHNNYVNSFPSGHTSTAFTTSLLLAFIVHRKWAPYVFPLIAFLVGYSRVYLAQHFVTDVLAGIFVGIVSSYCALLVYERFQKKKATVGRDSSPKDV